MKKLLIKSLIGIIALTLSLGVFTACGGSTETPPAHTHDYKTLKKDATNHWYECECGEKQNVDGHSGGTATCKDQATCDVCGEKYGDLTGCNFVDKVCTVCGNKQSSEGLVYEAITIDGIDGLSVTGLGTCTDTDIAISNEYDNKPILSIATNAFKDCGLITSVTIGDKVTSIGDYAFSKCYMLESVVIGNKVASIGESAFESCETLTSIVLGKEIETIGFGAFDTCPSLTIYCEAESEPTTWDSDWNYLGYPIVWDCNNNKVADDGYIYTVKDSVRYALKDNVATVVRQPLHIKTANILTDIDLDGVNYDVTTISSDAFKNCNSLTSVKIGNNVTSIALGAFDDCYSFTIYCEAESKPSGWESYWSGDCPVVWDANNNEVTNDYIYIVVDGVRYSLRSYSATDNIATVVRQSKSLKIADIPDTVTYKGIEYSVTSVVDKAFYDCDALEKAVIGDNVVSLGDECFYDCDSVKSVVIGFKVDSIGCDAFYGCDVVHLYSRQKTKPTNWHARWNSSDRPTSWGSNG